MTMNTAALTPADGVKSGETQTPPLDKACRGPPTMPDPEWRLGDGTLGMLGDVSFLTVWSRTALAPCLISYFLI